MRKWWSVLMIVTLFTLVVLAGCGQSKPAEQPKQTAPPAQQEEKKTEQPQAEQFKFVSSEEKKDGCASCHVKVAADKDYTLAAELKKIKGHPSIPAQKVSECLTCHKDGDKALNKVLHQAHFKKDSVFVSKYDGACVHCHKMTDKGQMVVAGLAPAGVTLVKIESASVDKAPNGCDSCHQKVSDDKDYTLQAELKKIKNHPQVSAQKVSECIMCHKAGDKPFKIVLHAVHLKSDIYKTHYGGSCLNCHTQAPTGEMKVKGL